MTTVERSPICSLHHVTATVDGAQADLDFCVGALGLRLLKKTVNFDNHHVYHFYYGDEAGTPGTIVSLLNYDVNRALSEDLLRRSLLAQGLVPAPGSSEDFRVQVERDRARWGRVLRTIAFKR